MPQTATVSDAHPLSEPTRVHDIFAAPGKTFADLHRSASWWLPCVLVLLCSTLLSLTAIDKVGVARLSENLLATMPRMQDMIANAKPADAALLRAKFDRNITSQLYTTPLFTLAASFAVAGCFCLRLTLSSAVGLPTRACSPCTGTRSCRWRSCRFW